MVRGHSRKRQNDKSLTAAAARRCGLGGTMCPWEGYGMANSFWGKVRIGWCGFLLEFLLHPTGSIGFSPFCGSAVNDNSWICGCGHTNRGPLLSKATALPTETPRQPENRLHQRTYWSDIRKPHRCRMKHTLGRQMCKRWLCIFTAIKNELGENAWVRSFLHDRPFQSHLYTQFT